MHSGNEVMNLLYRLLMCCILHILYNVDAMDDCDGLIYYGIDGIEFLDVQLMHLLVQKILQYGQHVENYCKALEMNEKRITNHNAENPKGKTATADPRD